MFSTYFVRVDAGVLQFTVHSDRVVFLSGEDIDKSTEIAVSLHLLEDLMISHNQCFLRKTYRGCPRARSGIPSRGLPRIAPGV